jgi:hypothetical protein
MCQVVHEADRGRMGGSASGTCSVCKRSMGLMRRGVTCAVCSAVLCAACACPCAVRVPFERSAGGKLRVCNECARSLESAYATEHTGLVEWYEATWLLRTLVQRQLKALANTLDRAAATRADTQLAEMLRDVDAKLKVMPDAKPGPHARAQANVRAAFVVWLQETLPIYRAAHDMLQIELRKPLPLPLPDSAPDTANHLKRASTDQALSVSACAPMLVSTSGGEFEISGTGFAANVQVDVGVHRCEIVFRIDTQLIVRVPKAKPGLVPITVRVGASTAVVPDMMIFDIVEEKVSQPLAAKPRNNAAPLAKSPNAKSPSATSPLATSPLATSPALSTSASKSLSSGYRLGGPEIFIVSPTSIAANTRIKIGFDREQEPEIIRILLDGSQVHSEWSPENTTTCFIVCPDLGHFQGPVELQVRDVKHHTCTIYEGLSYTPLTQNSRTWGARN